tara:strand:- start:92 stop:1081 length:990 start_codon:yes stop_codon:yes gene_type:complete
MNLIYFAFKYRYRFKDLNNFLKSRIYGNYILLNFSGPFKYYLSKILILLKIGRAISCDGRPLIKNKSQGYNFFIRGTDLNIPTNLLDLDNNIVAIKHPLLENNKIFQIYPINIKKNKMNDDIKIIFMSSIKLETNEEEFLFWQTHKEKILNNFTILDDKYFWQNNLANKNLFEINRFYRITKSLLRFEIVTYLKKIYDKKFVLIGEDWRKYSIDSLKSNYNTKKNKKIYKGNICLDTGSLEGSSSLYPRANQIIESGGLIVQNYAFDASEHWKDLKQDLLFKNFDELRNIIDKLINNLELSNILLDKISKHFKNSSISMEETLNRYFSK